MTDSESLRFKIALTKLPNIGAVLARNLVSFSGGVEAVFRQKKSALLKIPGIGEKTAEDIKQHSVFSEVDRELEFIEKENIRVLFFLDEEYPMRLKRIKDAPILLFYKGTGELNHAKILGIVGTRKPTIYGISQCEKFVEYFRDRNVLIISGLAYGIDIVSHRKALEVGLPTIGVMGNGLDRIYPSVHRKTAHEMLLNGGLLTEFCSGTLPDRENFPMRNRIIAGLCDALLVVESDIKGGSMITAEMANTYHKDVFALPGKVSDQWSRGCNYLIKTNRAALIDCPEDISTVVLWEAEQKSPVQRSLFVDLDVPHQLIYDMIDSSTPVSIDRLHRETQFSSSELASILLNLEFQGAIKSLPGKLYQRV